MTMVKAVSQSHVHVVQPSLTRLTAGRRGRPKSRGCEEQGGEPEYCKQEGSSSGCWIDSHKYPPSSLWTSYGNRAIKRDHRSGSD